MLDDLAIIKQLIECNWKCILNDAPIISKQDVALCTFLDDIHVCVDDMLLTNTYLALFYFAFNFFHKYITHIFAIVGVKRK